MIEKINIDENEAIGKFSNLNHVLVVVKIENDYLLGWHGEVTGKHLAD